MRKHKKPITLSRDVAVGRMMESASLAEENLRIAIEVESVLEEANSVVKTLKHKAFYGADSYNTLKQCMGLELAIALSRLFDSVPKRRSFNRSDLGSIPVLVHFLKQKRCQQFVVARAHDWPGAADKNVSDCKKLIKDALDSYGDLKSSIGGRRALTTLRDFRNVKLAHSLMGKVLKSVPTYSDLYMLVEMARFFMTKAKLALTGVNVDFVEIGRLRRVEAEHFWRVTLEAVSKSLGG